MFWCLKLIELAYPNISGYGWELENVQFIKEFLAERSGDLIVMSSCSGENWLCVFRSEIQCLVSHAMDRLFTLKLLVRFNL